MMATPPRFSISPVNVERTVVTVQHLAELQAGKAVVRIRNSADRTISAEHVMADVLKLSQARIVFNAPPDAEETVRLQMKNVTANRVGWAIKTTNTARVTIKPPMGMLAGDGSVTLELVRNASKKKIRGDDRLVVVAVKAPDGSHTTGFDYPAIIKKMAIVYEG